MIFTRRTGLQCIILSLLHVLPALAHMEMSWPYALHSKFNPANNYTDIDYSNTSPLLADGSNFPCKGYQNDRPLQPVVTYSAGSTYNMTLAGYTTHNGGSCQISLSYDNGATFRVIKSMIGGCPLVSTYDFTIPSYAPKGRALLAWTWENHSGNRELYMNCAAVEVVSGAFRRRRRQAFNSFESLPFIWKANLAGINDCTTIEGQDTVYPNPGPDVLYANGYSDSSPPFVGTCDSPTPYGQTYKDLGDSTLPAGSGGDGTPGNVGNSTTSHLGSMGTASLGPGPTAPVPHASGQLTLTITTTSTTSTSVSSTSLSSTSTSSASADPCEEEVATGTPAPMHRARSLSHAPEVTARPLFAQYSAQRPLAVSTQSTTTVTIDCDSTETVIIYPSTITRSSATSQPLTLVTSTQKPASTSSSAPRPPYASGSNAAINAQYLPCVPGTFLCTSRTTFLTCNYNDGTVSSGQPWVYPARDERIVAADMECLPISAPYSGETDQYQEESLNSSGNFRDDRYIRARPEGDCSVDGSLMCTSGGSQFSVCDHGGWMPMGAVASGTTCVEGKIIAA